MSLSYCEKSVICIKKQEPQQYYLRHLRVDVKQHLTVFLITFLDTDYMKELEEHIRVQQHLIKK
jgi:hypothetical protein